MEGRHDIGIVGQLERRQRVDPRPVLAADDHRPGRVGFAHRRQGRRKQAVEVAVVEPLVRLVDQLEPEARRRVAKLGRDLPPQAGEPLAILLRRGEDLVIMMHVEDDVEAGGEVGVDDVAHAGHELGIDRVGRRGAGMAREAHRQAYRRESRLADVGRVRIAERPSAPGGLARRLERVAEIDAFADRQGDSGGGAGGRRRRNRLPGRRICSGRAPDAAGCQRGHCLARICSFQPALTFSPSLSARKALNYVSVTT